MPNPKRAQENHDVTTPPIARFETDIACEALCYAMVRGEREGLAAYYHHPERCACIRAFSMVMTP